VARFLLYRRLAPRDSFAQKVIVITGGSRGLGLALARRLARERARLAILASRFERISRLGTHSPMKMPNLSACAGSCFLVESHVAIVAAIEKGLQQVKHATAALGFLYRAMCSN
jgi:NAD(P)-dependent dehydrogenase (short-subunit alcohol dehydrogenase family)